MSPTLMYTQQLAAKLGKTTEALRMLHAPLHLTPTHRPLRIATARQSVNSANKKGLQLRKPFRCN